MLFASYTEILYVCRFSVPIAKMSETHIQSPSSDAVFEISCSLSNHVSHTHCTVG